MLCRKQHAEIGLEASKIMILMLKIKKMLWHTEDEELETLLHEDLCQAQVEQLNY